jgi:hypothetical protein
MPKKGSSGKRKVGLHGGQLKTKPNGGKYISKMADAMKAINY